MSKNSLFKNTNCLYQPRYYKLNSTTSGNGEITLSINRKIKIDTTSIYKIANKEDQIVATNIFLNRKAAFS